MMNNSLKYIFRDTFQSLKRNPWLTVASVATVMITMIILGFSAFFLANATNLAASFESQVEIAVFVDDNVTEGELAKLQKDIKAIDNVALVTLVSKDDGLAILGQSQAEMITDLGVDNPLPDKFTVKVTEADQIGTVAGKISTLAGVDKVRYGQDFVDKLLPFTKWLRWAGIGVIAAFAIASTVLISINIKMNVFSRRKEIQIMRLVGASNGFIRWPFLIEGMFLGLFGGCLAALVVWFGYSWLVGYIETSLTFMPVVTQNALFLQVVGGILLVGMLIGIIGSAFSIRKFLKV